MKTKRIIYFSLILLGSGVMAFGEHYILKEYALSIGIVLLMLGIYKSTRVWGNGIDKEYTKTEEE